MSAPPAPHKPAPAVGDAPWLRTPSGIVAAAALVLAVFLPPPFFFLAAGLAFVLAVIALVRRRPRPRSAWALAITSGVLLVMVLGVGLLATLAMFNTEVGTPAPDVPVSVPAQQP